MLDISASCHWLAVYRHCGLLVMSHLVTLPKLKCCIGPIAGDLDRGLSGAARAGTMRAHTPKIPSCSNLTDCRVILSPWQYYIVKYIPRCGKNQPEMSSTYPEWQGSFGLNQPLSLAFNSMSQGRTSKQWTKSQKVFLLSALTLLPGH